MFYKTILWGVLLAEWKKYIIKELKTNDPGEIYETLGHRDPKRDYWEVASF